MRVLVTGGCGFIGSRLVAALASDGVTVAVMDDMSAGSVAPPPGCELFVNDVRSEGASRAIRAWQPQAVIHLAAQVDIGVSGAKPAFDADVNIVGTLNMLAAAHRVGARQFILASSCAIYGEHAVLPVSETCDLRPANPYGMAKAAATAYAEWYRRERGMLAATLVLSNVYGPGQRSDTGVVARFVRDLELDVAPLLRGDGSQTRDFVHVDDVVDAFVRACTFPLGGVLNIGTGQETSIKTLLGLVEQAYGAAGQARREPLPRGEIARMALDAGRARAWLGWRPHIELADGIRRLAKERVG